MYVYPLHHTRTNKHIHQINIINLEHISGYGRMETMGFSINHRITRQIQPDNNGIFGVRWRCAVGCWAIM